ncbi:type II toxin-antitoxin system RelE/ParE family toxin [Cronobacter turicensis]|uniref:type II toxin-antitoxin system RelE/ParE family toxin n=1 Tax=Cronobacter TaxID=413496 RepID=UPI0013EC1D75|nr:MULTISPECIES: type II toxin-antitoxin system RelE/ParE family toxin [Cronobacter]ELQ6222151.1 type II toxin-antitoxin system RelE/ParE family toxin [Cronobacter turicensis]ELQ6226811.1 type II toxin-antitoxin system RelE/ParE family toxin [Cronobacter turicensis]ELY4525013.1 type II toxin-antitoxin system RelE/ParE family toxin [Cronobacter turicensis]EMA4138603.1 type II toxin-antitoxin system RelE/ParE family toxin [Cronobacter turicensis]KAF6597783.1 type II toxin-antitoxin system RelE/P
MAWTVIMCPEFATWYERQDRAVQKRLSAYLMHLSQLGPTLGRPLVDTLKTSRYGQLKELRAQFQGRAWRILFAFDPDRRAVLLCGGNKTGNKRFYSIYIRLAEARFYRHLLALRSER